MPITPTIRRRAAATLFEALSVPHTQADGVTPIHQEGWQLFAARFKDLPAAIIELDTAIQAAGTVGTFEAIRDAAARAIALLRSVQSEIELALMFDHCGRPGAVHLLEELRLAAELDWLPTLVDGTGQRTHANWSLLVGNLATRPEQPLEDRWEAALDVPSDSVRDIYGTFFAPLLTSRFHSNLPDLRRRLNRLLGGFTSRAIEPIKARGLCQVLLDAADPVEVARTALRVRDLIISRYDANPDHTAQTLALLFDNAASSHANITMINEMFNALAETDRADRRAMLQLDIYRRMVEGQVKPWGWILICLRTGATGSWPMLTELHDRLRAFDDPLADEFAHCVEPGARNAAAHEDYHWEPRERLLVGGGQVLDPEVLDQLTHQGHRLMSGAELGWAAAHAERPGLLETLSRRKDTSLPFVFEATAALTRFATNDIGVTGWELDGDHLILTLNQLDTNHLNPCAQSLIECSLYLPDIEQFTVELDDATIMTASRAALSRMRRAWFLALREFPKMPPAVFTPIFFESRLLVEEPEMRSTPPSTCH